MYGNDECTGTVHSNSGRHEVGRWRRLRNTATGAPLLAIALCAACGAPSTQEDGTTDVVPESAEEDNARTNIFDGYYRSSLSEDICLHASASLTNAKQAHKIATTILGKILAGQSTGCFQVDDVVNRYKTKQFDLRDVWPPPVRQVLSDCSTVRVQYGWTGAFGTAPASTTTTSYLMELDRWIDSCAPSGVYPSAFISGRDLNSTGWYDEIDPEPAQLTQSLSGSNGASAAAVYVDSQTSTTVRKWPSTYTYSAMSLPAGAPCSAVDLASGATATGLLVKSPTGNYWKCS